ncbi:WecB/TagA/CpsF family glycosyltransferase [Vibrio alginolyticus]|uniref:WecB/TagA/CpsF family glycosyltransferase n=1 Tax=Vibrio alginolyticus TaxID=663 RepID=UPI001BD62E89|nr:WecB/TagA/CpsF family glycosyltransferase [Vibrio alginolyticus]MBT0089786.1 WecB/TagA/CpsF family glycosyltransferase [Vibrio alginolyticus]
MSVVETVKIYDFDVKCYNGVEHAANDIFAHHLNSSSIGVAINPEKIVSSMENPSTYQALEIANLRYLDGIGTVKLAEKKLGSSISRVPGCELWEALMKKAGEEQTPVYVLGATDSVLKRTVEKLQQEYRVNVVGSHDGYFDDEEVMINSILSVNPRIVTVALGSPRQELFMKRCKEMGADFFMMGVGGTYNVYTGAVARAPKMWCDMGLEWLYRLLKEPKRIFRQMKLAKFIYFSIRGWV